MGVTQAVEKRNYPFPLHRFFELSGHFERSQLFIFPKLDFDRITRAFASLLAYRFEDRQHVHWSAILDERTRIRHTVERRVMSYLI